jgi:uncharacterized membrane protein
MNEKRLRQLFVAGILIKGFDGLVEFLGGLVLSIVSAGQIVDLARWATRAELIEDPHDLVATSLLALAEHLSVHAKLFYALYLIAHGVIKLLIVWALLTNRLWAYPLSLAVLGLFAVYQIYSYVLTGSLAMIVLTVFDAVVLWLIWREYQVVRRRATTRS